MKASTKLRVDALDEPLPASLEILYIHDNRLAVLPPWIGALRSLTYLNVAENGLRSLPDVSRLSHLIELRAMHNRLTDVPSLPAALRELRVRGNGANQLSGALPAWLADLPRLEKLDLRWNSFDDPPVAAVPPGCVVLVE